MSKPIFYVDFNELIEPDLVMLSKSDSKQDRNGDSLLLEDGMNISVFMDDFDENGKRDDLVASGTVERNLAGPQWARNIKWCCRIDKKGIRHESDCE